MRAIMAAQARAFRADDDVECPTTCRMPSSYSKELLGAVDVRHHRCSQHHVDAQGLLTMFEARLSEVVGSLEDSLVERMVNLEARLSQLTRGIEESEFSGSRSVLASMEADCGNKTPSPSIDLGNKSLAAQLHERVSYLEAERDPQECKTKDIQSQLSGLAEAVSSLQKQTVALVASSSATPSVALPEELMPATPRKSHGVEPRLSSTPQKTVSHLTQSRKLHSSGGAVKSSENDRNDESTMLAIAPPNAAQPQNVANDEVDVSYRFLPDRILSQTTAGFTVISLNILAGYLGRSKTHSFCKEEHLAWENRKHKLIDGFKRARPDILLLQEVQGTGKACSDNHVEFLSESLSDVGYKLGTYVRVCGPDGKEEGHKKAKKPHLGNAVYFQSDTWNLRDHGRIAFAQLLADQCSSNDLQQEHYAEGRQVAAWARLQHAATQRNVVAVSVHIFNKHTQPDKQVAQVNAMLRHLRAQVLQEGDVLVIGGDFNSLPHSGVYQLLSTGVLHAEHSDASPCLEAQAAGVSPICGPEGFCTGLKLASAYAALHGAEPELTTKAPGFSGTIDYLWYSPGTIAPEIGTGLKMPTVVEAGVEGGGLPNSEIPSDHVPIGLAFAFPNSEHVQK